MRYPVIAAFALSGCATSPPLVTATVDAVCTVAESDLPEQFELATSSDKALALKITRMACLSRAGLRPVGFLHDDNLEVSLACSTPSLRGYLYVTPDNQFHIDYNEVCPDASDENTEQVEQEQRTKETKMNDHE